MKESTTKSIKKSLTFEKSGETLSVEISMKDVSSKHETEAAMPLLDTLFEKAKKELGT